MAATILFMANNLIMSIIWVILQSPDLAITEAAVGTRGHRNPAFYYTV